MSMTLPSSPTQAVDRAESFFFRLQDASTMVLVRTFWAIVVLGWCISTQVDFGAFFYTDGLQGDTDYKTYRFLTLFRWVDGDLVRTLAMFALVVSAALVVFGRRVRITVPVTAFLHVSFLDIIGPWSIGAEGVLMIWATYMALFALVTPTSLQGHFADANGSRGLVPAWGLALMQFQLAFAYISTAASKLRGNDWIDGSAVFHVLASDTLRRFTPPDWMFDNAWVMQLMTWGTLGIEAILGPMLLWPKTRRLGVVLALALHLSFGLFLDLGFFAAAMAIGILSFTPPADARRILDRLPRRRPIANDAA